MAKIEAIIFDCFGVLVTESWFSFKHKYFGHDEALAAKAMDIMDQANVGMFGYDELTARVGKLAGISAAQVNDYLNKNVADEALLTYISDVLKPNYKIGMLSNASQNWLTDMLTPGQLALFDAIDLSYESGFAKPEKQAYANMAEELGVNIGSCVFTDDQQRYCVGAQNAGMQAIVYEDFKQFKRDLSRIL